MFGIIALLLLAAHVRDDERHVSQAARPELPPPGPTLGEKLEAWAKGSWLRRVVVVVAVLGLLVLLAVLARWMLTATWQLFIEPRRMYPPCEAVARHAMECAGAPEDLPAHP